MSATTTAPPDIFVVLEGPFLFSTDSEKNFVATSFSQLTVNYNPSIPHSCIIGTWQSPSTAPPQGKFVPLTGQKDFLSIPPGAIWTATRTPHAEPGDFDSVVVAPLTASTPTGVYIDDDSATVNFKVGSDRMIILPMPDSVSFGAQLTGVGVTNTTTGRMTSMRPYVVAVLQYKNSAVAPVTLTLSATSGQQPQGLIIDGSQHFIIKITYNSEVMEEQMGGTPMGNKMELQHMENGFAELMLRVQDTGTMLTLAASAPGTTKTAVGPVDEYEMGVTPTGVLKPRYDGQPDCPSGNIVVG
jgi:hypothetical protein